MIYLVIYLVGFILTFLLLAYVFTTELGHTPDVDLIFSFLWPVLLPLIIIVRTGKCTMRQIRRFRKWLRNDEYNFHQAQINKTLEEMFKNKNNFKFGR